VKFQHDQLLYSPGDHLAIFPTNSKDKVEKLCQSCIFDNRTDAYTPISAIDAPENEGAAEYILVLTELRKKFQAEVEHIN